jgi:hypothetical protein
MSSLNIFVKYFFIAFLFLNTNKLMAEMNDTHILIILKDNNGFYLAKKSNIIRENGMFRVENDGELKEIEENLIADLLTLHGHHSYKYFFENRKDELSSYINRVKGWINQSRKNWPGITFFLKDYLEKFGDIVNSDEKYIDLDNYIGEKIYIFSILRTHKNIVLVLRKDKAKKNGELQNKIIYGEFLSNNQVDLRIRHFKNLTVIPAKDVLHIIKLLNYEEIVSLISRGGFFSYLERLKSDVNERDEIDKEIQKVIDINNFLYSKVRSNQGFATSFPEDDIEVLEEGHSLKGLNEDIKEIQSVVIDELGNISIYHRNGVTGFNPRSDEDFEFLKKYNIAKSDIQKGKDKLARQEKQLRFNIAQQKGEQQDNNSEDEHKDDSNIFPVGEISSNEAGDVDSDVQDEASEGSGIPEDLNNPQAQISSSNHSSTNDKLNIRVVDFKLFSGEYFDEADVHIEINKSNVSYSSLYINNPNQNIKNKFDVHQLPANFIMNHLSPLDFIFRRGIFSLRETPIYKWDLLENDLRSSHSLSELAKMSMNEGRPIAYIRAGFIVLHLNWRYTDKSPVELFQGIAGSRFAVVETNDFSCLESSLNRWWNRSSRISIPSKNEFSTYSPSPQCYLLNLVDQNDVILANSNNEMIKVWSTTLSRTPVIAIAQTHRGFFIGELKIGDPLAETKMSWQEAFNSHNTRWVLTASNKKTIRNSETIIHIPVNRRFISNEHVQSYIASLRIREDYVEKLLRDGPLGVTYFLNKPEGEGILEIQNDVPGDSINYSTPLVSDEVFLDRITLKMNSIHSAYISFDIETRIKSRTIQRLSNNSIKSGPWRFSTRNSLFEAPTDFDGKVRFLYRDQILQVGRDSFAPGLLESFDVKRNPRIGN